MVAIRNTSGSQWAHPAMTFTDLISAKDKCFFKSLRRRISSSMIAEAIFPDLINDRRHGETFCLLRPGASRTSITLSSKQLFQVLGCCKRGRVLTT